MITESKKTIIGYWIFTAILCLSQGASGVGDLIHHPELVSAITALGYPEYLLNILGIAKIIGVVVLLVPNFPRLKEWAYAGFAVDFIGAFLSHYFSGDGIELLAPPIIVLIILMIGYTLRPNNRKLPSA